MFFRVSWYYKDKVRYFFFRVLPYGLPSAPYIFTKIFRPFLVTNLMTKFIKLLLFLERVGTSIYLCPPLLERNSLSGKTILGLWMVDLSDSDKFLPVSIRAIGTPVAKDTSCYDWVWENNWLVLLVSLIPRLSGILRIIKLRVLLSYPNWAPSRSGPCSSCSSLLTIPLSGASLLLLTLQEFLSGASPSPFSTHPSLMH